MIATSLENFTTEIRELQRPEIAELFESYEAKKQVGSSTMPHKQNPEICERVAGLARIVRSLEIPALEDMVTWHERDLTQSSTERFVLPESSILLDYILSLTVNIVCEPSCRQPTHANQSKRHRRPLNVGIRHDYTRQKRCSPTGSPRTTHANSPSKAPQRHKPFKQTLLEDKLVSSKLSEKEIDYALNPKNYTGTAAKQAERFAKGA